MKITEINGLDNTVIERDATAEEIAQLTADSDAAAAAKASKEAEEAEKAIIKAAALAKLGLTEDELKAVLA